MKKVKSELNNVRCKLSQWLLIVATLYLIFIAFKFPEILETLTIGREDIDDGTLLEGKSVYLSVSKEAFHRKVESNLTSKFRYGRITGMIVRQRNASTELSYLEKMAEEAWILGSKAWKEMENNDVEDLEQNIINDGEGEVCPSWISMEGEDLSGNDDKLVDLPCALTTGSSVTVIGRPHKAHREYVPQLARIRKDDGIVSISQFIIELQGLKSVDGEAPPKILHLNPRLRGDWSKRPVIEHNTCYRMQWGTAHRCDGTPSSEQDHMRVDGYLRCEKWISDEVVSTNESRTTSWYERFIGRQQKPEVTMPFPFVEGRLFTLTLRAGFEGFHIIVGGQHVTSFPYRPGFTLEDATGLAIKGGVEVHSVYATSLPTSRSTVSPYKALEMSEQWKVQPLPTHSITLFVGVLSASNHFAERMAIRKTWMQSAAVKSQTVVVRFFVALNSRKEVNAVLKKETEYFADVVILPFVDRYDLVVLKTIAICNFGVSNVSAAYVMKCDDDTFVRVDTVLKEINGVPLQQPLYMGNLNLFHRPLRNGKWAVTYEEWPESVYPPYANGPGYVISRSIAEFVVSQNSSGNLRIFKMEDVSMGMWVQQYNSTERVQYSHSWKFCQYGCMRGYYTAHYQSPRQMICLWEKLAAGRASCCNFR